MHLVGTADMPTYLIAYSNNKTSAARIHFDIAHELGHICLHEWSEDIEELSKEEFKRREREANDFAAAFLLPEETFRKDAEAGRGHAGKAGFLRLPAVHRPAPERRGL